MEKQTIKIDAEFLHRMYSKIEGCERALQALKGPSKSPASDGMRTSAEFMEKVKIRRWKFLALIAGGKMKYRKIDRRYYVPEDQIERYFNGELQLD